MSAPGLERIPLARPSISAAAIAAANAALGSGWPGPGPEVDAFEAEFSAQIGGREVVAVNSATAALHLAALLLDAPAGSEVITTPLTFVSTNHVLLWAGLVPVFADIDPTTGNIDPADVEQRLTAKTVAVMAVHYGGYPVDLDALYALAERHGLAVIEDCAHAAGATYRGRPIGSGEGHCAFSFNATKNLPAVRGGALVVPDEASARRARRLRWMGIDRSTHDRSSTNGYTWRYDVPEGGFAYAMDDVTAAVARIGLHELAGNNESRRRVAGRYRAGLAALPGVTLLADARDVVNAHYLFAVLVEGRDDCIAWMRNHGVDVGVHYLPNYRYPMFAAEPLPNTEHFSDRVLSLPMYPDIADAQVDRVVAVLRDFARSR